MLLLTDAGISYILVFPDVILRPSHSISTVYAVVQQLCKEGNVFCSFICKSSKPCLYAKLFPDEPQSSSYRT